MSAKSLRASHSHLSHLIVMVLGLGDHHCIVMLLLRRMLQGVRSADNRWSERIIKDEPLEGFLGFFLSLTHSVASVTFGEPCSGDSAFAAVAAAESHTVVPLPGRNHCACECKSMYASR